VKVSIPQRDLASLLKFTGKTVERRNTIPILGNVLLKAEKDQLSVRATDLDVMLTASVACEVTEIGITTVPAQMLENIVKKIKADIEIKLSQAADESVMQLRAGRSNFKLQTLPESDFPDLPVHDIAATFEIPAADLLTLLGRSEFCMSEDETRYYLNGVFFQHMDGVLRAVATDGHKLARIEVTAPEGAKDFQSGDNNNGVIIPKKTVKDVLLPILKDGGHDKVTVQIAQTKVIFTAGRISVTTKLIDGTFPDYERVVPKNNNNKMRVEREELKASVARLTAVASERGGAVKLSFAPDKLMLAVVNPDAGSATDELDGTYEGEAMDIGFNSHYMTQIMDKIEGDQVEIHTADPGSPTLMRASDKPGEIYVLMPMRV
jgi:DNA polymerase-3 subunit beta